VEETVDSGGETERWREVLDEDASEVVSMLSASRGST
jgi:hypothetical protein